MTTIIIEDNSPQAKQLLEYIKTLPYATVIEEKKKSFREAAEECNSVSVDTFIDELEDRIKKRFDHA
jgi:predicted HTH domain antitoxin